MKRVFLCSIAALIVVLFIATGFEPAASSSIDNEQRSLPDFLERLAEYLSKGNASELIRYRNEITFQERIKQYRIKSTNGAVLRSPEILSLTTDYGIRHISQVVGSSEDTINPFTNEVIGKIEDEDNLAGWSDGDCAYLEATGWYTKDPPDPNDPFVSGEAIANGLLDDWAYYWTDIYAIAKEGPLTGSCPPWYNYLVVMVSDTGNWDDWHYVGYAQPFSDTLTEYYIGPYSGSYLYLSPFTFTPANWTTQKSSLFVDNAYAVCWWY